MHRLYLFWVPDFLKRNHGLDLKSIGPPLAVIHLVADAGSIGGGWISSRLIKRGRSSRLAQWLKTNSAEFISAHVTSSIADRRVAPPAVNCAVAILSSSSVGFRE